MLLNIPFLNLPALWPPEAINHRPVNGTQTSANHEMRKNKATELGKRFQGYLKEVPKRERIGINPCGKSRC